MSNTTISIFPGFNTGIVFLGGVVDYFCSKPATSAAMAHKNLQKLIAVKLINSFNKSNTNWTKTKLIYIEPLMWVLIFGADFSLNSREECIILIFTTVEF